MTIKPTKPDFDPSDPDSAFWQELIDECLRLGTSRDE
jgi:hypothetical protein